MTKSQLPYTAKFLRRKTFTVFQPIAKVFPLNHLLCTVHDGHGLMHGESFPVNGIFCTQPRKFCHNYTVYLATFLCIIVGKKFTNLLASWKFLISKYHISIFIIFIVLMYATDKVYISLDITTKLKLSYETKISDNHL